MTSRSFYTIVFECRQTGRIHCSRTFTTLRVTRTSAKVYQRYANNVRIMLGGSGGMEVK